MKNFLLYLSILPLIALVSCATLGGVASLMTCSYDLKGVSNPRLAGIGLSGTSDLTKLDAVAAARVAANLLAGNLPLSATVNVGISNPNATAAKLAGLEWALFFEDTNMLGGQTDSEVYVAPNGGSAVIPLTLQLDLAELFKGQSRDQMMRFANGLLNIGEADSKVSLRIRPAVSFGGQVFKTGYITLSKKM